MDTAIAAIKEDIRAVRAHIVALLVQMDDITLQQLPQIRADYALKIGCWEQALLEAELAARRARRRLALAQAQVNRGEAPQLDAIDAQLDVELADWMSKAEQARLSYEHALSYLTNSRALRKGEAQELKRLYHLLVKRLHPDVRVADGQQAEGLFSLAQAAYRNGDVQALRSLEVATRHLDPAVDDLEGVTDLAALQQELELARIEEGVTQERLDKLLDCEELRLGRLLASPEWVFDRARELRKAVEEWERVRADCDQRVRQLEGDAHE